MKRKIFLEKQVNKKKPVLLTGGLCLCIFLALLFSWRNRRQNGVLLVPLQDREIADMVYFMQKDSRWGEAHLGEARDTMASSGCLVCCLAAGLDMQARDKNLDLYMTAGQLNEVFSREDVYTESGAVIWNKIQEAVPGTICYVADTVNKNEIDQLLADGIFPVVKVRMGGVGAWHWVLLTGTDENGYVCMDPMGEAEVPVSLSEFQDRVYSVRAVYFAE